MAILNYQELAEAYESGRQSIYQYRKVANQTTTTGLGFDLSMSPVAPQYYAATPLKATTLSQSADGGLFHGASVTSDGFTKYLDRWMITVNSSTPLPIPVWLLDYLLYYPFVDEGSTDLQTMDNTNVLTRYTDGEGVRIMCVSQGSRVGGQQFYVTYTNQDGVGGRVTPNVVMNTGTPNGNIITTDRATNLSSGLFLPLQGGDTGVRSVEGVTMLGSDSGLFAIVLVKPLVSSFVHETSCVHEKNMLITENRLIEIKPDAYLNMVCIPQNSLSAIVVSGDLSFVWG